MTTDLTNKRLYPKFSMQIRGRKWQIYVVSQIDMAAIQNDGESPVMGLTVSRQRRIYLLEGQSLEELYDSLMHEWLHACAGTVCHSTHSPDVSIPTAAYEEMLAESVGDAGRELLEQAGMVVAELRKLAIKKSDTIADLKV